MIDLQELLVVDSPASGGINVPFLQLNKEYKILPLLVANRKSMPLTNDVMKTRATQVELSL